MLTTVMNNAKKRKDKRIDIFKQTVMEVKQSEVIPKAPTYQILPQLEFKTNRFKKRNTSVVP